MLPSIHQPGSAWGASSTSSAGKGGPAMIDASFSRQRAKEDRADARGRRRLIIPLVSTLVLIGGVTAWALGGSKVDAPPPNVVIAPANSGQASDELLETAKGPGDTAAGRRPAAGRSR